MKTTLIILAAGKSSRYGSLKQTELIGPSDVALMEYSIYDAISAGFTNVILPVLPLSFPAITITSSPFFNFILIFI